MAKDKKFNFDNLKAEVAALGGSTSLSEKKAENRIPDVPAPRTSTAAMPAAALQDTGEIKVNQKSNDQLSMPPKKKLDQRVSFMVYKKDYDEFTRINKQLGYSNNEIIINLISKYIKSNL